MRRLEPPRGGALDVEPLEAEEVVLRALAAEARAVFLAVARVVEVFFSVVVVVFLVVAMGSALVVRNGGLVIIYV